MKPSRILTIGLAVSLTILGIRWLVQRRAVERLRPDAEPVSIPLAPAAGDDGSTGTALPRPLRPGEPLPDTWLVDPDGRKFRTSELKGNVVVLSFFYTHCELPSGCPMTTAKLVHASEAVQRHEVQGVRFLMVSFDTERDRPERLREYASRYEADSTLFQFAAGGAEAIRSLSLALNTFYRPGSPGVFDHNIVVSVVDREGILRRTFSGTEWTVEELISSIERLAGASRVPETDGPDHGVMSR